MINTEENLDNILPYRPNWSDIEKTSYIKNLNFINANRDKLLKVHHDIIADSIYKFDYLTDTLAEFVVSYLKGKC